MIGDGVAGVASDVVVDGGGVAVGVGECGDGVDGGGVAVGVGECGDGVDGGGVMFYVYFTSRRKSLCSHLSGGDLSLTSAVDQSVSGYPPHHTAQ